MPCHNDVMSIFDEGKDLLGKAEDEARTHPQQADKIMSESESLADKESGGKYDQQIQHAGDQIGHEWDAQNAPAGPAVAPAN